MITIEELLKEANSIQQFLEISVSDNPEELVERLSYINVLLARTGKMLADAKLLQDRAITAAYTEHMNAIMKMTPTVSVKFINAITLNENYLVNWLDRMNRVLVHSSDNIRTQISYNKEQLRLTKSGY